MISESLYFIYDSVNFYETYNILNVKIESGLFQEQFLAPRTIKEQRIRGRHPYFVEIEEDVLSFDLSFAFGATFTEDILRAIARDLRKEYYCPMVFSESPDRIFYCLLVGEPQIVHTGLGTGYIKAQFRCNSPYSYSATYTSIIHDYTINPAEGTELVIVNSGDLAMSPTIYVEIISGSSFSIVNNSNGAKTLTFTGLTVAENLTIDCENEEIKTDLPFIYRYDNMTGNFLSLVRGNNNLRIFGNIKIQFIYQFIRLQ